MSDSTTTLQQVKDEVRLFTEEREWQQFHSPKNLSMNIAAEAAELMEKFLWITTQESFQEVESNRQEIEDEVADVFHGLLCLCNAANIDLSTALRNKRVKAAKKYPIEKARGNYTKYDKL